MYGTHINSLNLYIKSGSSVGSKIWTKSGTQGNKWIQGKVDVSVSPRNQVCYVLISVLTVKVLVRVQDLDQDWLQKVIDGYKDKWMYL